MQNKVLILASVASMIDQFNMNNIEILKRLGYEVHVACNFNEGNTCSVDRIKRLKEKLKFMNVSFFQIDFTRSVFNIRQDIIAYQQVKKIVMFNQYKFIHCHSPIGGVIGRMVCKNLNTECIYTAHGFHFYKGAPLKNWILFYPIEKYLSKYTDVLITITTEDFIRAKTKMKMKKVVYIPGVGVDIDRIGFLTQNKKELLENNLDKADIILLSVGELNRNKNHEVVIRSIKKLNNNKIHYLIAGTGVLGDYLHKLIIELGLENQVHILGFRNDIIEIMSIADIYIHPSFREGLSLSIMEAMASGLPCIVGNIRGNKDLIDESKGGFLISVSSEDEIIDRINKLCHDKNLIRKMGEYNKIKIKSFCTDEINKKLEEIYVSMRY